MDSEHLKNICSDSLEVGINIIKNLYELKKKKQHLTLNAITNKKSILGLNSADSKNAFEEYINQKRKLVSESNEKLLQLSLPQVGHPSTFHLNEIKKAADWNKKELEKIHKTIKRQLESSKSLKSNKSDKNLTIYDKKCFEIYCLMCNEFHKKPTNSNYANLKEKWLKYTSDFYSIFLSVKNWGDISNPIDIDGSSETPIVEMKNINFKEEWYTKPTENSAIDAVDSGLAGIFNTILETNQRFSHTLLKTYAPYQTDEYKAPKRIISKLFMSASGKKFALCNEFILLKATGLNEYEVESLSNDSEIEEEVFSSASGKNGKRKIKKPESEEEDEEEDDDDDDEPLPKKKVLEYEEEHQATVSEVQFAINELNTTINNTVITSSEFFSKFNQLIDSLEQKSALFFKEREYPPLYIYPWHLEEMIGRCDTLISTSSKSNYDLINIKNSFMNLLQKLENHKSKHPFRTPFFNSFDNEELISNWGDIFVEVDKQLSTINNLKVIKLNMFDPKNSKVLETQQNTFLINKNTKIMEYQVDKNYKDQFFDNLYKSETDSIKGEINKIKKLLKILKSINKAMDNDVNFSNWFSSGEKLMSIKRKFYKYNADINSNGNFHDPGFRQEILTNQYFDDLFDRYKTDDVVLNLDNIDYFNEAIRGYYSNPKIGVFQINNNNPTFIDKPNDQVDLFAGTFYPGCYTKNCKFKTFALIHEPNLGEAVDQFKKIKLLINIKGLKNLNVPKLVILQSIREQLNFNNNRFDLQVYENELKQLSEKLNDINSLKNREFKVKFDIFADSHETMQPIIAKSNIDRSLAKNQDSLTLTKGSSGSGKTFTINGNGQNKKGFFEALASMDPNKFNIQIELFEFYHIAMPFEESFLDSINKKLTFPRLWRYDINSTTYVPSLTTVKNFNFNSTFPIQSFIKNYSRNDNSGIRTDIDEIRSKPNAIRQFPTIRETVNNKVSSRSVFLQALKVQRLTEQKSSYNIIIDRPGEEDPLETFNLKNLKIDGFSSDEILLALNNPIIGFLNKYNTGDDFYIKKINWKNFFNAFGFVKLDSDMLFIDYLEKFLSGSTRKSNKYTEMTANVTSQFFSMKSCSVDEYISLQFMNDLDEFANINFKTYQSSIETRFKDLFLLEKPIIDYLKNIHNNEEWLNFEINCENFKEFNNPSQNLLFNGFKQPKIKIKDLFTMDRILKALKMHNGNNASKFLELFGADNFFHQIECPLLGHINFFEIFKFDKTAEIFDNFLAYFTLSNTGKTYYISQNYLKGILEFAVQDIEYQLSLDLYSCLCSYGNQSYLNTYIGISNFLMAIALYFSIFKNPDYIDFYDAKIKKYYDIILNDKFELVRGFFEAVSINEINNNQQTLNNLNYVQPKQNITLNTIIFNSMKYYNDLILPKFEIYEEYDRVTSVVKHSVIDFTCNGTQNLTLRLNRLAVTMRHLDLGKETDHKNWTDKFQYIMTRVFNKDIKWISVAHDNFENSSELYINDSQLLEVYVFNPFVEKMPSGRKSCVSIINNMM